MKLHKLHYVIAIDQFTVHQFYSRVKRAFISEIFIVFIHFHLFYVRRITLVL